MPLLTRLSQEEEQNEGRSLQFYSRGDIVRARKLEYFIIAVPRFRKLENPSDERYGTDI